MECRFQTDVSNAVVKSSNHRAEIWSVGCKQQVIIDLQHRGLSTRYTGTVLQSAPPMDHHKFDSISISKVSYLSHVWEWKENL